MEDGHGRGRGDPRAHVSSRPRPCSRAGSRPSTSLRTLGNTRSIGAPAMRHPMRFTRTLVRQRRTFVKPLRGREIATLEPPLNCAATTRLCPFAPTRRLSPHRAVPALVFSTLREAAPPLGLREAIRRDEVRARLDPRQSGPDDVVIDGRGALPIAHHLRRGNHLHAQPPCPPSRFGIIRGQVPSPAARNSKRHRFPIFQIHCESYEERCFFLAFGRAPLQEFGCEVLLELHRSQFNGSP